MTTSANIETLRALLADATPGPWEENGNGEVASQEQMPVGILSDNPYTIARGICKCSNGERGILSVTPRDWFNAKAIVAMRNSFEALLEVAEAATNLEHCMNPECGGYCGVTALRAALDKLKESK